ncbi:GT-D fold domain-containing glycosyltransferase [Sphingobacterium mizutaii]|uniref:GT-D fold domain-containing glycosyltransferase n=1 Tax=Sphingobacterium mizutaii TaxID=1010 RepID=UPI0028AB9CBB|nr:GT-D fold domain-containing glycosyltransferase [Sphingobacterium mizutaii]
MNILHRLLNKIDWKLNVSRSGKELQNNKLKVMTFEESLDYLIESKCSLSRFGDGEFTLMLNGEFLCPRNISLKHQDADPELKKRLVEILKDKNTDQYNLKIAVPRTLVSLDKGKLTDSSIGFWQNYLHELFYKISSLLRKDYTYLNSQISRFYLDDRNKDKEVIEKRTAHWKSVWEDQDILIIEGKGSNLGKSQGFYANAKSVERIECPNNNTFKYYNEILSAAKDHGSHKLIILALGPTSALLAYDLAKAGFRALDLGYLELEYHFFLTQATEESRIAGIKISTVESIQNDPFPAKHKEYIEKDVIFRITGNQK